VRATPTPVAVRHATSAAAQPPSVVAKAASAPPAAGGSDLPLLRDAQQTVRTYLTALISGDDATAQSQLLANSGTSASELSEKGFLDKSSRIVDMTSTATSPTTASVDVDIQSGKGSFYAHYELRRLDSGVTLILEHNYAKPP
jgi:hypothetical protein